jgi:hypothetical protein
MESRLTGGKPGPACGLLVPRSSASWVADNNYQNLGFARQRPESDQMFDPVDPVILSNQFSHQP